MLQHGHQVHHVRFPWRRHISLKVDALALQLGIDHRPQARLREDPVTSLLRNYVGLVMAIIGKAVRQRCNRLAIEPFSTTSTVKLVGAIAVRTSRPAWMDRWCSLRKQGCGHRSIRSAMLSVVNQLWLGQETTSGMRDCRTRPSLPRAPSSSVC